MMDRIRLIILIYRRAMFLFLLPIVLAYVVLPLAVLAAYKEGVEEGLRAFSYSIQTFLPLGVVLWEMAYLQIWIDSAGKEALYACSRGKHRYVLEVNIIMSGFLIMLIPEMIVTVKVFGFLLEEYLRLIVEIAFSVSAVYLLSNLLSSVTMGGMLVILYLLFCIFCAGNELMKDFSILQPNALASAQELKTKYSLIGGMTVVLFCVGYFMEKRHMRR